jgi:MFS family permease
MFGCINLNRTLINFRSLTLLALGVFGIGFALGIYESTYTVFLIKELNIDPFQIGALESIREIPGLLSALLLGSVFHLPESILAGIFLMIFGFGIGGASTANSLLHIVFWSVIWSVGFHSWSPLSSSMVLNLSRKDEKGKILGEINSVSAIASMLAMASVALFSTVFSVQYRSFFLAAGTISFIPSFGIFRISKYKKSFENVRFVLERKYSVYYLLNFLEGARRQIFLTFAPLALIEIYNLDLGAIALLMLVSRAITFFSSPFVGKIIDRIGSHKMLTLSYILMIIDLLGYVYIRNVQILIVLYIINSFLMTISMISRTTYISDLASVSSLAPSLAMGQTMDHIAAVILPLTGGFFWQTFGYEATFLIGVTVAILLLFTAQGTRKNKNSICRCKYGFD